MSKSDQNVAIVIRESDYNRLTTMIERNPSPQADALDAEIARADVVPDSQFAGDAVAMHSQVTFEDLDNGERTTVTLVWPAEADVATMKISVLTPVGSALIGLPVGGEINWPLPGGRARRLRVVEIC